MNSSCYYLQKEGVSHGVALPLLGKSVTMKISKPIALQSLLPMSITLSTIYDIGSYHGIQWLTLSNECFNFCIEIPDENRSNCFSLLLEEQFGPVPLLEAKRDRMKAEYTTVRLNAHDALQHSKSPTITPLTSYRTPSSLRRDITNTTCLSTILPSASLPDRTRNVR